MAIDRIVSPYILVGCGGSGIKTLQRLTVMLAEDPNYRNRIAEEVAYLVLDTNRDDLHGFSTFIDKTLSDVDKPIVKTVELSGGLQVLTPMIEEYFSRRLQKLSPEDTRKAKERLLQHWWFEHDDFSRPFHAPNISPLHEGAGQCPRASYILTWKALSTALSQALQDIISHLKRKLADEMRGSDPLNITNMVLVGSLAGGTGRGCWELVCFKMRALLGQAGSGIRPITYFFDASVFETARWPTNEQLNSMRVNSLTGISQLSCWLQNAHDAGRNADAGQYHYQLPNIENPAEERNDVIDTQLMVGPDSVAVAPVHGTYLIFNQSPGVLLGSPEQYYDMLGIGLYTLMRSTAKGGRMNDNGIPYGSLAAASFEVPIHDIRRFAEDRSQLLALRTLADNHRGNEAKLKDAVQSMHRKYALASAGSLAHAMRGSTDGTAMEQICQRILEASQESIRAVQQAMQNQDVNEASLNIDNCLNPDTVTLPWDDEAAQLSDWMKLFNADVKTEIGKLMIITASGPENSPAAIRDHFLIPVQRLLSEIKSYPDKLPYQPDVDDDPPQYLQKAKRREQIIFGVRFNEAEIAHMRDILPEAVLQCNYPLIVRYLRDRYHLALESLERMIRDLSCCLSELQRLSGSILEQQGKSTPRASDVFSDPSAPSRRMPEENSTELRVSRKLHPVLSRIIDPKTHTDLGVEKAADAMVLKAISWRPGLREFLAANLLDRLGSGDELLSPMSTNERTVTWASFRDAIRHEMVKSIVVSEDYLENRFNLMKALDDLRLACEQELRDNSARRSDREKLRAQFEDFFGVLPAKDGDEYRLPGADDLLEGMIGSLASTCRPFWITETNDFNVVAFVPHKLEKGRREQFEERAQRACGCPITVKEEDRDIVNPYCVLVLATAYVDKIEDIRSLNYWRDHATVIEWLKRAEDPSAIYLAQEDRKGLGYTSPIYVKAPELSQRRWKPWGKDDVAAVQRTEAEVCDALLYALLDCAHLDSDLGSLAEGKGWSLPLIEDVGSQRFVFKRRALCWDTVSRRGEVAAQSWESDSVVCQSIWQVFDVLAGRGDANGNKKSDGVQWREWILAERSQFMANVLPSIGAGPASDRYRALLKNHQHVLIGLMEGATRATIGLPNRDDKATWGKLVTQLDAELRRT